jgi:hypothetical protein
VTPWELPAQDNFDDQDKDDKLFLQLLDQYAAAGREVNDPHHRYYAPALFANETAARAARVSRARLGTATWRKFESVELANGDNGRRGSDFGSIGTNGLRTTRGGSPFFSVPVCKARGRADRRLALVVAIASDATRPLCDMMFKMRSMRTASRTDDAPRASSTV